MNEAYIIMISSVLVASVSQILLKKGSLRSYPNIIREYVNPYVICGYALLVLSTILTVLALRGMAYKNVPIIESSGYIVIMFLSWWLLKEKLTTKKIVGNIIILIGILIFYL